MQFPSYQDINAALQRMDTPLNPSEAHGMLCALICTGNKASNATWVSSMFSQQTTSDVAADSKQDRALVLQLFTYSFHQLSAMNFEFKLLLPDDENTLALRSECLGLWCYGFMTGLQTAGIDMEQANSQETKDALLHFSGIASIDYQNIAVTEEDEKCYMEVSEYVRMAVLMLYSELAGSVDLTMAHVDDDGTVH